MNDYGNWHRNSDLEKFSSTGHVASGFQRGFSTYQVPNKCVQSLPLGTFGS